ncbi:DNA repair protein RAD50 [Rhodotorula toruloides]|nr:DNA repair protein RAD50 [Rhodotorula toruloides]
MGGGLIFLTLLIAAGAAAGGWVSVPKGENQVVIRTSITLAITCCWLMWAITYLAQLHPLIKPIRSALRPLKEHSLSSLDKLAIRGIRSFDSNEISVMQFYSPLTVIVGHNGSGKTTIIECLKYATTGDLPPGSKGGAWIHDPAIAGTSEVKAQVKLRFNNLRKEKMLVERRLQVTKKKTASGLSMKTLEGVISYADADQVDKKKRQTLSTKCANIDEEVPTQLGVSKAILQNVIFCHQEESNWPLSEPAALKKKFDDIFEATDYTKVLDEIKRIRKDQNIDIKVDKEKLAALKTDRDRAFRLRENLKKVSTQISVKQATYDELEEKIAKLVESNKKFFTQASKYQDIIGRVDTLRERRKIHEENLNNLLNGVKQLPDSEHELKTKIENHEADLDKARSEREATKQELGDEQDTLANFERKRSAAQTTHGRLLALKQRHQAMLEARKSLIRELSEKHEIPGYDHELNEREMQEFEEKMEDVIVSQQRKIEKIKSEARATENKYQDEIQALKSARAADERAKASIADQIRAADTRIANISRQLDATTTTVADIMYQESLLAEEKERRQKVEDQIKTANYTQQLRDKAREAKDLEERRDALHNELAGLNAQANTRARLQLRRTERKRKDEAIASLIDKSAASFRKFAKADPQRESMEAQVSALVQTLDQDVTFAERASRDAARELQNIETSVSIAKKKIKDLKQAAEDAKTKIKDGLRGLDTEKTTVQEALEEAEEELAEVSDFASIQKFYDRILNGAKKNHVCLGCDRSVSRDELPDLERYVMRRKEKAPQELRQAQQDMKTWTKQLDDLKRLVPIEVNFNRITKEELPAAETSASQQEEKLVPARQKAEETNAQLNELKDKSRDLQSLRKAATEVTRLHREAEDVESEIGKLESELSATGSTATSEEIQEQLSQLGEQIRAVKAATEKVRAEQQSTTNTLQTLSTSIHQREMDLSKKRQEVRDKETLEQRQNDAREEIAKLEKQSKELDKRLSDAITPIRQKEGELATIRADFTRDEAAASRQLQVFNKSAEQLDSNKREIRSYESRGGDAELQKCERELKQHENVIGDMKTRIANLQAQVSQIDKMLADSQAVLRNLQDNLRLRSEKRSLESIDSQIDELDEDGARKAYRKFETDYNEQRRKQTEMQAEQARLGGEIQSMTNDRKEKEEELNTEYKDIDEKYRRELINLKTAEMANQDLEKLQKALDGAIMRFHGLKMREINETIADLWTKTYQGTDIDKIMIKADSEGKTTGAARSYNYRVVMFKDQTEMDMRGRCSAGQKVLASIIIRLALAESFSVNCGIMALDEPTTNLDQDNIKALASSLAELIQERKGQSNFQLIVITHDENFLQEIGSSGVLDKYWRVSRGEGGQVSTIERQRLN